MGHRTRTFDEPEEPDTPGTEEKKSTEASVNELESRLLKGRKIKVTAEEQKPQESAEIPESNGK